MVLVVYFFQVVAVDHWHTDPADVRGVEGTSRHIAHCHGDASGCSEGASALVGTLTDDSLTPLPPSPLLRDAAVDTVIYVEALLPQPEHPPRAS
jgi:hypothetical protein